MQQSLRIGLGLVAERVVVRGHQQRRKIHVGEIAYRQRAVGYGAKQGDREQALHDIDSAERLGSNRVEILTATGDALLTLGDRNAAMQRFSRALEVPAGDRIGIRLAIAEIFIRQHDYDDARREIALGFAESRLFPDSPVTAEDFSEAANLFLSMHDFDLAENYYTKAQLAGANSRTVAIGLTNTYLAEGDTRKAESALGSLGPDLDGSTELPVERLLQIEEMGDFGI